MSLSLETRTSLKPLGTLEAAVITRKDAPSNEKRTIDAISRGYKTEAFQSCSTNLADAGKRLRGEAEAESQFWRQIMSIKANGWAVSRMPRQKEAWAVHFGFAEADQAFRDRGIATLKRQGNGDIYLDFGPKVLRTKFLSVTISDRNSGQISRSRIRDDAASSEGHNEIQRLLLQARDSLFDEEVYHEVCREARTLTSYGVETKSEGVVFEIESGRQILINLVDTKRGNYESNQRHTMADDLEAEELGLLLRLLLSHAHSDNLQRRSQPPPPMTLRPRTMPEYYLVRPLLCHSHHQAALQSIQSLLSGSSALFHTSKVPFTNQASCYSHLSKHSPSNTHPWLSGLISEPLVTTISLTLPTFQKLNLRLKTQAAPPTFGTELTVAHPLPKYAFVPVRTAPRLNNIPDIEDFILQALNNDLLAWVESKTWPASGQPTETNGDAMDSEMGNDDTKSAKLGSWEVYDHLEGSLKSTTLSPAGDERYHMKIRLQHDRLSLRIIDQVHPSKHRVAYTWRVQGEDGGERYLLQHILVKDGSVRPPKNIPMASFEETIGKVLRDGVSDES